MNTLGFKRRWVYLVDRPNIETAIALKRHLHDQGIDCRIVVDPVAVGQELLTVCWDVRMEVLESQFSKAESVLSRHLTDSAWEIKQAG